LPGTGELLRSSRGRGPCTPSRWCGPRPPPSTRCDFTTATGATASSTSGVATRLHPVCPQLGHRCQGFGRTFPCPGVGVAGPRRERLGCGLSRAAVGRRTSRGPRNTRTRDRRRASRRRIKWLPGTCPAAASVRATAPASPPAATTPGERPAGSRAGWRRARSKPPIRG
jgi:hypothetical protein